MNKLRYKYNGNYIYCTGNCFVPTAPGYVTVYRRDTIDEIEVSELEIKLSNGTWKNLVKAFNDRDVIEDNLSTEFREPLDVGERFRGFYY